MQTDHATLIKERLNIVDVVGSYVRLEKAGQNFKACCPFHNEKTPSFFVVPDKNIFHCFGCGKGGDIFSFVEEIEGVGFREALTLLAERAGVSLSDTSIREKGKHDQLYHALELATRFFEVNIRKDVEVVDYLVSRGLTKETITAFRIGYVPDAWRSLSERLRAAGVTEETLLATGLIIKKDGRTFDRFRNRIMFPLADSQGRIIGFSGRVFDARSSGTEMAKYMNSPETELYHKGSMLYAYDKAKKAMRETRQCLLVEGQFDVVLAHQAGTTHTVALSGTGLTTEHCTLIQRFSNQLVLALDGDEAGIRASRRSVLLALREGLDVSILPLPAGDDPASIIARSREEWTTLLATATVPVLDFELALVRDTKPAEQRTLVRDHIFPIVRALQSPIVQDQALGSIAHALGISVDALRKEFDLWAQQNQELNAVRPTTARVPSSTPSSLHLFIGLMAILAQKDQQQYSEMERAFESFAGIGRLASLLAEHADRLPEHAFIFEHTYGTDESHVRTIGKELLLALEHSALEEQLQNLRVRARRAETSGSSESTTEVLQEIASVTTRLHELRHQRSHY